MNKNKNIQQTMVYHQYYNVFFSKSSLQALWWSTMFYILYTVQKISCLPDHIKLRCNLLVFWNSLLFLKNQICTQYYKVNEVYYHYIHTSLNVMTEYSQILHNVMGHLNLCCHLIMVMIIYNFSPYVWCYNENMYI